MVWHQTDTAELYRTAPLLEERMRALPGIEDVSLRLNSPQVQIDREQPADDGES